MNQNQLKSLKDYIAINGGATLAPDGSMTALSAGYMVSLQGHEKKTTLKKLSLKEINSYLNTARKLNAFAGLWLDGDVLYIDISIRILHRMQAIAAGIKNKQLAIYDLKENQSIYIK